VECRTLQREEAPIRGVRRRYGGLASPIPEPARSARVNNVGEGWKQEQFMNWDEIEGNWTQFKGKVRSQWGKLTDDDLDVVKGKRDELLGLLQKRYGHAKEQAERELDRWAKELK
jgi:uncharacterized protein YjbJ (UPF0337 family)